MSARPGFVVTRRVPTDGGVSPNAYVPQVTVEVRVHFPPTVAAENTVQGVLRDAHDQAQHELLALLERLRTPRTDQ